MLMNMRSRKSADCQMVLPHLAQLENVKAGLLLKSWETFIHSFIQLFIHSVTLCVSLSLSVSLHANTCLHIHIYIYI